MSTLASAVRAHRRELRLTQVELSQLAGCGPVFVYALEKGKATLRFDKLLAVLQVLGLELTLGIGKRGLVVESKTKRAR